MPNAVKPSLPPNTHLFQKTHNTSSGNTGVSPATGHFNRDDFNELCDAAASHYTWNDDTKEYDCNHCDKKLNRKKDIEGHVCNYHLPDITPVKCNYCEYTAKHYHNLVCHLEVWNVHVSKKTCIDLS